MNDLGKIHVLMGHTGSGKSTIAKWLNINHLDYSVVSTSEIVRDLGGINDPAIQKGKLFPDENALRNKVFEHIDEALRDSKVVLDGFPRTVDQYKWLIKHFINDIGQFILIDVDMNIRKKRLLNRKREDIPNYDDIAVIKKRMQREIIEIVPMWVEIEHDRGFYVINGMGQRRYVINRILPIIRGDICFRK